MATKSYLGLKTIIINKLKELAGGSDLSGTNTSVTANKLVDSGKDFSASGLNVQVNDIVFDDTGNDYARVTAVDNATTLSLNTDIIISGDAYEIDQGAAAKDKEYLIDNGWTIVDANGTSN